MLVKKNISVPMEGFVKTVISWMNIGLGRHTFSP